jgi:hypothetical protein
MCLSSVVRCGVKLGKDYSKDYTFKSSSSGSSSYEQPPCFMEALTEDQRVNIEVINSSYVGFSKHFGPADGALGVLAGLKRVVLRDMVNTNPE